jgi:excinuclease UvrABC ATPase subunit
MSFPAVVVIEHNLEVIKTTDWTIDLGVLPEAVKMNRRDGGGTIPGQVRDRGRHARGRR